MDKIAELENLIDVAVGAEALLEKVQDKYLKGPPSGTCPDDDIKMLW